MSTINKVILIGNLGNDPELRTFENGDNICIFNIATSEKWKDKQTGENKEVTYWHYIQVSGKMAELCNTYLNKGSKVYIEGKLKSKEYEKEGLKVKHTFVKAKNVTFLNTLKKDTPF